MSFNQDILAKDTNLYPVVIINKDGDSPIYISTNSTTIGGQYYSPVLLNVPALRESIDIEKRNYKISNITLSISNYEHNGERFSEKAGDSSLINQSVDIYWISPSVSSIGDGTGEEDEAKMIYSGWIQRYDMDSDNIRLSVEDRSQKKLHRDLPTRNLGVGIEVPDNYKNKPVPMVFGNVKHSPCVIEKSPFGTDTINIGSGNVILIMDDSTDVSLSMEDDPLSVYTNQYVDIPKFAEVFTFTIPVEDEEIGFGSPDEYTNNDQWADSDNKIIFTAYGTDNQYNAISDNNIIAFRREFPAEVITWNKEKYGDYYKTTNGNTVDEGDNSNSGVNFRPSYGYMPMGGISISGSLWKEKSIDYPDLDVTGSKTIEYCQLSQNQEGTNGGVATDYWLSQDQTELTYTKSIVGCSLKMNTVTGNDIIAERGYLNFSVKVTHFNGAHSLPLACWMRVGGNDSNDHYPLESLDYHLNESGSIDLENDQYNGALAAPGIFRVGGDDIANQPYADFDGGEYTEFEIKNFRELIFYNYVKGLTSQFGYTGIEYELPYIYVNHWMLFNDMHSQTYYANVVGRESARASVPNIVNNILRNELYDESEGFTGGSYDTELYNNWKYDFTIKDKIGSKRLIEELASASPYIPRFNNRGEFTYSVIKKQYAEDSFAEETTFILSQSECISWSFSRTPIEDVKTAVKFKFNYDFALDEFMDEVSFSIKDKLNDYDYTYYGFLEDNDLDTTLIIDDERGRYISDSTTAQEYAKWMLYFNCNQHIKIKIRLPIQYMNIEVGNLFTTDELLDGIESYGISYHSKAAWNEVGEDGMETGNAFIGDLLNGQQVYPFFLCTGTNKTMDYVEITGIQLHNLTDSIMPEGVVYGVMHEGALNFNPQATYNVPGDAVYWTDFLVENTCPWAVNPENALQQTTVNHVAFDPALWNEETGDYDLTLSGYPLTIDGNDNIFIFETDDIANALTTYPAISGLTAYWQMWHTEWGQANYNAPEVYISSVCEYEDYIPHFLVSIPCSTYDDLEEVWTEEDHWSSPFPEERITIVLDTEFMEYFKEYGELVFKLVAQLYPTSNVTYPDNNRLSIHLTNAKVYMDDTSNLEPISTSQTAFYSAFPVWDDSLSVDTAGVNPTAYYENIDVTSATDYDFTFNLDEVTESAGISFNFMYSVLWSSIHDDVRNEADYPVGEVMGEFTINIKMYGGAVPEFSKTIVVEFAFPDAESFMLGDTNGDGNMNVLDIVQLANCVLQDS